MPSKPSMALENPNKTDIFVRQFAFMAYYSTIVLKNVQYATQRTNGTRNREGHNGFLVLFP